MKYWKEQNKRSGMVEGTSINRETVVQALEYIKRGHLPDWNYSTRKVRGEEKLLSLPDEHYPLHIAVNIAMEALKNMPDSFFADMDKEENRRQEKIQTDLERAHEFREERTQV